MTILKGAFHDTTGRRICEVFDDTGTFVATVVPGDPGTNSLLILSKHFNSFVIERSGVPPVFVITFKPVEPK